PCAEIAQLRTIRVGEGAARFVRLFRFLRRGVGSWAVARSRSGEGLDPVSTMSRVRRPRCRDPVRQRECRVFVSGTGRRGRTNPASRVFPAENLPPSPFPGCRGFHPLPPPPPRPPGGRAAPPPPRR